MIEPAGDDLGPDLVAHVLLALPVYWRLQMMTLSHTWQLAGADAASWAKCDLVSRPSRRTHFGMRRWPAHMLRRAITRAGPNLTLLKISINDDLHGVINLLSTCGHLAVLEFHGFPKLEEQYIPTLKDLLDALPAPPFRLKRLELGSSQHFHGLTPASACQELTERTDDIDIAKCDECSRWECDDGPGDGQWMFPCAGLSCSKRRLCGGCFQGDCVHCNSITCMDCTNAEAFECTTCFQFFCSVECANSFTITCTTRDVAGKVNCIAGCPGVTCGNCVVSRAVRDHTLLSTCEACGGAPCAHCAGQGMSQDLSAKIKRCGGSCGRAMCDTCSGHWHPVVGMGIACCNMYCCQRCYDEVGLFG